ncbi:MAG: SOS response-associated peptidase [Abitibacteriaceae bacterium]|nr:SOS response-associated peptidase [Abditibacteriaceae bacterium]MBV9866515.1 SOS response-associated peptidase [Abditibacteriaceae bacterium]
MCGRYTLHHSTQEVAERFGVEQALLSLKPRYNVAPSQQVPVITQEREFGLRYLEGYQWGLVPFWAKDASVGQRLINARAETADERPAFKWAIGRRRCIIPADGFYEWKREEKERIPVYFSRPEGELFGLAGLWEEWKRPDGSVLHSCAIMTTVANGLVDPVCTRMPVILRPQDEAAWLDPRNQNVPELMRLLRPYPEDEMEAWLVSQHVNSPFFDDPSCAEPIKDRQETLNWIAASAALLKKQNRLPKRRCVRRDHVVPGGQVFFQTKSFTRSDGTRWHPIVDIESGPVFCDCPDFHFRHARHEPDIFTPQFWCKHVARAVENCRRHGEI